MSNNKIKLILAYNSDRDDFFPIESEEMDPKTNTYLIIDEIEEKSTLSFPEKSSLIQKRTIERRVSSYLKVGYPVDDQGLRIGANFPLEKLGPGEVLPDVLMTHGHSFGKSRLKRDEVPEYVNKDELAKTTDVVPGSAATSPMVSGQVKGKKEEEVFLKPTPTKIEPEKEISLPKQPEYTKTETITSDKSDSDNELFALGQFVDQFVRKGKIVMVQLEEGKYKIQTLKNVISRPSYDLDAKYEVDGTDLFEA